MKKTDGFIRDPRSGAVVNIDNGALEAYKRQKQKLKRDNEIHEEIDSMKKEMSEVKDMLSLILEKLK